MPIIERDELKALVSHREPYSVSIFMTENLDGKEMRQDPIRLKNLLGDAEAMMVQSGMRPVLARERLDIPRRNLLDNAEFWRHVKGGLAVFVDSTGAQWYRVPMPMQELVVVDERFHLKPLMGLMSDAATFFLLALSQQAVRLLRCGRFEMQGVPLRDIPKDFPAFLDYFELSKQVQLHAGGGAGQGIHNAGIFHGQGMTNDKAVEKKRLLEYCVMVDSAVRRALGTSRAPLVLAAAEPLNGIYHQASHYAGLYQDAVEGNPDLAPLAQLHRRALAVLEPAFARERRVAARKLVQAMDGPLGSSDLETILVAADDGQVNCLFVAADCLRWGHYDSSLRRVERHASRERGDVDLLDLAAVRTFANGGTVYLVPRNQMPVHAELAAHFRFAPVAVH